VGSTAVGARGGGPTTGPTACKRWRPGDEPRLGTAAPTGGGESATTVARTRDCSRHRMQLIVARVLPDLLRATAPANGPPARLGGSRETWSSNTDPHLPDARLLSTNPFPIGRRPRARPATTLDGGGGPAPPSRPRLPVRRGTKPPAPTGGRAWSGTQVACPPARSIARIGGVAGPCGAARPAPLPAHPGHDDRGRDEPATPRGCDGR